MGELPPAQTTAQVSQYYMSHLAEFDVVAGASKQTCSGAEFATPVAISRRRLGPSTVALMRAQQQAEEEEEEDKGHEVITGPTLAENQRPMYAIPSEGWMTQADSWRYNASEDANRKSMLLRQFPTTWQSTRRLFGHLLGSTSSVEEDHASVRISGPLEDHARSSTWRSAGGGGAVRDMPTSDLRSSGGGGLGPTSLTMLVDHPHQHNSLLRSPSPPSLQPPPPPQSVLSSRRRLLSVAALTGVDEPVYPVLGPPTTTNTASAATVPTSRFYS